MFHSRSRPQPFHGADLLLSVLLALLLVGGLLGAVWLSQSLRQFVATSRLPIFPSAEPALVERPAEVAPPSDPAVVAPDEPLAETTPPPETAAPAPVVVAEPLTVLLLGVDRRATEEGPTRTDTMILLSVDPATQRVSMLSLPRDLYVTMPDYGDGEHLDRINKAFFWGDFASYPGGGAALAKRTIRRNFGIEVDRYLVMDFDGFRRIIDEIGGIEIDVPEPLVDNAYPTEDYGTQVVSFEAGPQHMDGERALIYSRTRHSTSDFARAERQQQVILAVRDRVLSLDILPALTPTRLARLIATVDDSIVTDLSLDEVVALAQLARTVEGSEISRAVVDATMVSDFLTNEGAQVLMPLWNKILPLVEETFDRDLLAIAPTPVVPSSQSNNGGESQGGGQTGRASATGARITVLNGTASDGLEVTAASDLQARGFNVAGYGVADRTDYEQTLILLFNPNSEAAANRLRDRYGLAANSIIWRTDSGSRADIMVILGSDAIATHAGGGGRAP